MSDEYGTWSRHYQESWHERSGDRRLPRWLRVTALAYGSHDNNGHAQFKRGDIALILGSVDGTTGEIIPLSRQRVYECIQLAIELDFLAEGSNARCLIVPAHHARKGKLTDRVKPCPIHVRRAA